MLRRTNHLFLMAFVIILAAGISVQADTLDIDIVSFDFTPDNQTVTLGTTVRWTNQDAAPHTSTADNLEWDSGTLTTGQTFLYTFDAAGTFPYHCTIHPSMLDTITVTPRIHEVSSLDNYGLLILLFLILVSGAYLLRKRVTA